MRLLNILLNFFLLQDVFQVAAYPLVEVEVLVVVVFAEHELGRGEAVLVAGQLVAELLLVACQPLDFLLAFAAELGADGGEQLQHHVVHQVVSLHEEVGVLWDEAEAAEQLPQGLHGSPLTVELASEPVELLAHAGGQQLEGMFGTGSTHLLKARYAVEIGHREGMGVVVAVEPDVPEEEGVDGFGVAAEEVGEVDDVAVVECGQHADLVEPLGKALVVLDGVGVGLQDVGVGVELARSGSGLLQQVVVVAIHAGDEAAAQGGGFQGIHQHHLLPLGEGGLRGEHHLEVALVVLVGREDGAPEGDVVIALHIGHDALARLLGREAVGSFDIG